jgi:hypothetical protein
MPGILAGVQGGLVMGSWALPTPPAPKGPTGLPSAACSMLGCHLTPSWPPFPSEAHPLFPLPWKGSLASWQGRGCKMGTFISLRSQPSILQDISLGGREGVALL